MTIKGWAIIAGAILLAGASGFGAGRYAVPAKVVTVTKTETKTEIQWKDRDVVRVVAGPTHTVTVTRLIKVEVPCPPGATTVPGVESTTTTTTDSGPVVTNTVADHSGASATNTLAQTTTTVTQEQPRWLLQAGAAAGTDLKVVYDVGASYRLLRPFWAGAAYHTDKRLELRVGLTF